MANILPSVFNSPQGCLEITDPDPAKSLGQKARVTCATITCGHCNCLIQIPPKCPAHMMPYALCWGCRRHICLKCDDERARTLKCDVIENKLERIEARDRFRESF